MNETEHRYKKTLYICLAFWGIAPVILALYSLSGGHFWDGFAGGGYKDSSYQDWLQTLSAWAMVASMLVTLVLTVYMAVRNGEDKKRYVSLAVLSVLAPPAIFICTLLLLMLVSGR